ncbi:MotA/TolQ/ExbB proton channel family protein [Alcanivorax hongdengensis A-11-3]|uniref:MotA/TolQ/ExbB proton channel family protein n=1 Tax=Alcanivorax hongdengensis A-11-3 TaxID=1177179 RepID=L0WI18_9GAMM|nr:MotA/TolQ/ExbB proton channel family protein [Alcanivorax hongdengensis]EKF75802.1 MotA/TolQ/ExbB proton channel family protein [Alcanivorax hongdengensis A-11-3]
MPVSLQLPEWLVSGGPTMWALTVLSVVALATLISKLLQFARQRPLSSRRADALLDALERGQSPSQPGRLSAPVDRVIWQAWQQQELDDDSWEEDCLRRARQALEPLHGGLRILEVISAVAPLLGLLGTVFGMISAFQALEQAGSQVDPAILSGGIWEALLTTAAGLVVAIPALAAFHWADRTIEQCREKMQDRLSQLKILRRHHRGAPVRVAASPKTADVAHAS